MRKGLYPGLIFLLALALCACGTDMAPTTRATVPETAQAPTETTAPPHSALYLSACSTEQILEFFEEVVLHIEYSDGSGNSALVQKWLSPIRCRFYGDPTAEDLAVLAALFEQLNAVPGFPGIHEAVGEEAENLTISFLDPQAFSASFSQMLGGEDAYGATEFWYYTDTNEIHTARIGLRTDIDQAVRNSILVEEIINTLGISDTAVRPDSIVYQYTNDNTTLSVVDWIIVKLLYDPAMECGMTFDECRTIIERLYY